MANDIWSYLDAYVTHIARTGLTKPDNNSRRVLTLRHRRSQSSPQHGYDERSSMESLVDTPRRIPTPRDGRSRMNHLSGTKTAIAPISP
jgi:hypothetical protein